MSIARRMLRNQVRKNIKEAKKQVPSEYRKAISFSDVFNLIRKESKSDAQLTQADGGVDNEVSNGEIKSEDNT